MTCRGFFFQVHGGIVILRVPDAGAAKVTGREHADAADGAHRDGPAAGESLGNDGEHGGPEEGLAEAINGGGGDDDQAGLLAGLVAQQGQADGGKHRTAEQQAKRRKAVHNRTREKHSTNIKPEV